MIQEKYQDYELSSYGPLELELADFTVSDEEVAAEMERIAARHSTNVTVDPHPVRADDMILIDIDTKEGTNPFPGLTHKSADVQLGVGALPEEIEVALLGHEVGDEVEAKFLYTDNTEVASDQETPADGGCGAGSSGESKEIELVSKVKILAIRKFVIPEITDKWVAKNIALAHTVEEFRKNTEKKLYRQRRRECANSIEYTVMEEMGKRLVGEPPVDAVSSVKKQMIREFERFIEQFDMDRSDYMAIQGLDDLTFADQINQDARDRVAQDIALAAWATHFGIEIDDDDINFMFGEPTPERTYEARVEAEQSGQIDMFKDLALRAKVTRLITLETVYVDSHGVKDEDFGQAIEMKYHKQQMVRDHATADPMLKPPLVPMG